VGRSGSPTCRTVVVAVPQEAQMWSRPVLEGPGDLGHIWISAPDFGRLDPDPRGLVFEAVDVKCFSVAPEADCLCGRNPWQPRVVVDCPRRHVPALRCSRRAGIGRDGRPSTRGSSRATRAEGHLTGSERGVCCAAAIGLHSVPLGSCAPTTPEREQHCSTCASSGRATRSRNRPEAADATRNG
jgi:hypothetical protein